MPVSQIWQIYQDVAYISREDFDGYYRDVDWGFVLVLEDIIRLGQPVTLAELKSKLNFTPLQSFILPSWPQSITMLSEAAYKILKPQLKLGFGF
jgi:predicted transcriptional regulator